MTVDLHFREVGEGRPLVILHGLFGMNDNWQSFARSMASAGYRCILVDLRNHGHSPHAPEHTYKAMAADVAALLEKLQLRNTVVMGHSMGGKTTMQLAIDFPDSAAAYIVVDIAPWIYPMRHDYILEALERVKPEEITERSQAEARLAETISNIGVRQFLLKNLVRTADGFAWRFNLKVLAEQIEEVGKATWPEYPISAPVLFVDGGDSDYLDHNRESEIMQLFPNAEFITIPGAGHWVHADQPKLLEEAVRGFLE